MKQLLVLFLIGGISAISFHSGSKRSSSEENREPDHRGCDRGWIRSDRPSGGWCIKVFSGEFTQPVAEGLCQKQGATLSGLQDANETSRITDMALKVINYPSGSIWVGAQRTPNCIRSPINANCTYLIPMDRQINYRHKWIHLEFWTTG